MSKFRLIPLGAALLACAAWAFLAVTSYPFIGIADSDLGISARKQVEDASAMLGFAVAAVVLATRIIPWSVLRLALIVALLGFLAAHSFDSTETSHAARWPTMAILGLAVVAEWVEVRRPLSQRLHPLWFLWVALILPEEDHIDEHHNEEIPHLKPLWLLCVAVLVPLLVVLSDWQWRIYLGQMASKTGPRPDQRERLRTYVSLMDRTAFEAISRQSGLRAVGSQDGNLTVEPLAGGPCFFLPAQPDHVLDVLSFSPDGRVLAVADNHCMYEGSVITVWDVKPGDQRTPPSVVRRHTLGGHSQWTFSLDFFLDGRTLISANGDKTVSLWDVTTGEELASFVPHHRPKGYWDTYADCVAAAPDGQSFVTWAIDGIKVWDRQSLQLLRRLDTRGSIPCSLAFTPDGSRLIAADREAVHTWALHPSPLPFVMSLALLVTLVCWLFWPNSRFQRMPVVATGVVACQPEVRT